MQYGYARISTKDQCFNLQIDALKKSGSETIFKEIESYCLAGQCDFRKFESLLVNMWLNCMVSPPLGEFCPLRPSRLSPWNGE